MTYALNELDNLLRKAAVGGGFPVGNAIAIAAAGVWLARRGFPVCEIVQRALSGGMAAIRLTHDDGRARFDTARAAIDGVAAIDLLLAGAGDVVLCDLDEPRLVLGLAGAAGAANGTGFALGTGEIEIAIGGTAEIAPATFDLSRGCTLQLTLKADLPGHGSAPSATRYDPAAAGDCGWDAIQRLAYTTYVPASDQSRLSGAGAGLTDND